MGFKKTRYYLSHLFIHQNKFSPQPNSEGLRSQNDICRNLKNLEQVGSHL